MLVTEENLVLATEILSAAREGANLADFESESRLMPIQAGRSHADRMHMLRLLIEQGTLSIQSGRLCLALNQVPDWLLTASQLGYEAAQDLAIGLLPSDELKRKFDDELLTQIGLDGERALVRMISRAMPDATVRHMSLFDDTLGYDIAVEIAGQAPIYLEVKTSSRVVGDRFTFFLSRNEELKSRSLNGWQLACMSIANGVAQYRGRLELSKIRHEIPQNRTPRVEWQSLRIQTSLAELEIQEQFSTLTPTLISPDRAG